MRSPALLEVERDGFVAILWLNRPDARNALDHRLWSELARVLAALSDDSGVRAVVVAGRGPHFCAGLDLKELSRMLGDTTGRPGRVGASGTGGASTAGGAAAASPMRDAIAQMQAAISAIASCPKPVIAAVQGACLGAGLDLATACDIRLASADARFSVRETRLALVADLGTLQRLPKIVGSGHVAELAFTGKDVGAARAKEIGLVNEVYDDHASLLDAALALAREIADLAPLAVQGTKAVLAATDRDAIARGLEDAARRNVAIAGSDDLAEAITAFFEHRAPRFSGH